MASFIPEIFATRYRYTGAAVSYNIGGIVDGAVPPMAAALLASFGSWAIGAMMALCGLLSFGLLSFVCAFLHPETIGKTLADNIRRAPTGTDIPALVREHSGRFREVTCRAKNSWNRRRCADQGNTVSVRLRAGRGCPKRYGDG